MSAIAQAGTFQLDDVIRIQRERRRTQQYRMLGPVVWVCLEVQTPTGHRVTPQERLLLGRIDYMNAGPMLAISNDSQDLLLPGGAKPFPDVPDPLWVQPRATRKKLADPNWKPETAPMLHQSMSDRSAGVYENAEGEWVIFQPVVEVWYRMAGNFGKVTCLPSFDTRMALMINAATREAFFYGGMPVVR